MKRTFLLLLLVLMSFCFTNAQVSFYVPQESDPSTMSKGNIIVLVRDSKSQLWLYETYDLSKFRDYLMNDANYYANEFNRSSYRVTGVGRFQTVYYDQRCAPGTRGTNFFSAKAKELFIKV